MTIETEENKVPRTTPADADAARIGTHQKSPAEEIQISPTISGYFQEPKATVPAFFKVLRTLDIKRFAQGDEAHAVGLMEKMDPTGDRLWGLMSQGSLPESVDRWIWGAAQQRLKSVLGEDFDPQDHDADRILKSLRDRLAPIVKSEDKIESKSAENWLRLGICWLVEKRSLPPWGIAERMLPYLFVDPMAAARLSKRALQRGKPNEFRLAISMAGLGQEMVKTAQSERDSERLSAADLRHRLADARSTIERLHAEAEALRAELDQKVKRLVVIEAQLTAERQHWGHDLTEAKAEQKVLLGERVAPLLSDAIDALEIEPSAPGVALRRLKAILSIIGEAKA